MTNQLHLYNMLKSFSSKDLWSHFQPTKSTGFEIQLQITVSTKFKIKCNLNTSKDDDWRIASWPWSSAVVLMRSTGPHVWSTSVMSAMAMSNVEMDTAAQGIGQGRVKMGFNFEWGDAPMEMLSHRWEARLEREREREREREINGWCGAGETRLGKERERAAAVVAVEESIDEWMS